jgi:ribose-phosphate pyrophosphokinase
VLEVAARLGTKLADAKVGKYADGEISIAINDSIRGKNVYVIQSTCPPVNDNLMELFLILSALRRSSANKITAVIPYYGYGRSVN